MKAKRPLAIIFLGIILLSAAACCGGGGQEVQGRIVFTSDREANVHPPIPEIYIMDADGSNLTNITNNPLWDWQPSWSP